MSCVELTAAQKKKNIYKHTKSGRSKAMEFSHIMRNVKFDLTRKKVDCDAPDNTIPTPLVEIIYLIGGFNNSFNTVPSVYKYTNSTWNITQALTVPRAALSTVTYNGNIYTIGGFDVNNVYLKSVEMFDGTLWKSNTTQMLINERGYHASVVYNGFVYVIGGINSTNSIKLVEYYNGLSWNTAPSMINMRDSHSVVVYDNKIYVIGGTNTSGNTTTYYKNVEIYDKTTNTWTTDTKLLTMERSQHTSVVYKGNIYAIGGINSTGYLKSVDVFNGSSWSSSSAELSKTRTRHSAVVYDDKIYVIGGLVNGVPSDTIEVFDGNSWSQLTTTIPQPLYFSGVAIYNK